MNQNLTFTKVPGDSYELKFSNALKEKKKEGERETERKEGERKKNRAFSNLSNQFTPKSKEAALTHQQAMLPLMTGTVTISMYVTFLYVSLFLGILI